MPYKLRKCTVDINKSVCNNYVKLTQIDQVWKKRMERQKRRMERKKGKKPTVRNQPTIVHQSPQAVFLENLNLIPLPPPPPSSNTNDAATVVKKNAWWSQPSCLEESAGLSRPQGGETVVQDSPPPPTPPPPPPPSPPPSNNNNNNNNVVPIANFIFYRPEDSAGEQEYQQEYPLDLSMKKKSPVREEEIALAALKSCNYSELARHYSERLGFTINESTVRGIKKSYLYKVQKGEISPPPPPSSNDSSNNTETVSDLPPPPPPPPQSSATAEEEDLVESAGKQASSSTDHHHHHHHHHHQSTVQETCEVLKKMDSLRLAPCTRLTGSQRKQLETMFLRYPYPNSSFKKDIADRLQLTEHQVTEWYSGKRKRVRGQKDFSVILPTHHLSPPPPSPPPSAEDTVHLTANKRYPPHRYRQDQVDCLISAFHTQTHPNIICRSELASKIGLRLSQVTDWFQNRRRKEGTKNTSIFSLWVNEERAKIEKTNPELPYYVVTTILESYWKSMTSEEKRAYSEKESTKEFVTLQEEEHQHQLFYSQTRLNVQQTGVLESTFVREHYPDSITVEKLADKIGEAPIRVRNWFKRRRAKERVQSV